MESPADKKLIKTTIASARPTQIAQKSIIIKLSNKITTEAPKSFLKKVLKKVSPLDKPVPDKSPEAIINPNAKRTPKSLTEPVGLKAAFLLNSNGKTNIFISCSNSKIPKMESEARNARRETTMSRLLKVIKIESAKIANKNTAAKLSGAAQEPIKLPIWLTEKNDAAPQIKTKTKSAAASQCPG